MHPLDIKFPKHLIAHRFSQWAALSALKSGSPLKSAKDIYPLVDLKYLAVLLKTENEISSDEFNIWHKAASKRIMKSICNDFPCGWATKILNVYLRSMCYLSGMGRPDKGHQILQRLFFFHYCPTAYTA